MAAGFVGSVVPDAELMDGALALAAAVVERPRRAIALTKHALNAHDAEAMAAALEREGNAQVDLLASDEFARRSVRFRAVDPTPSSR